MTTLRFKNQRAFEQVVSRKKTGKKQEQPKPTTTPAAPRKTALEIAYAAHLSQGIEQGKVIEYLYKSVTFPLDNGAPYTPRYLVVFPDGVVCVELVEKTTDSHRMHVQAWRRAAGLYPGHSWDLIARTAQGFEVVESYG